MTWVEEFERQYWKQYREDIAHLYNSTSHLMNDHYNSYLPSADNPLLSQESDNRYHEVNFPKESTVAKGLYIAGYDPYKTDEEALGPVAIYINGEQKGEWKAEIPFPELVEELVKYFPKPYEKPAITIEQAMEVLCSALAEDTYRYQVYGITSDAQDKSIWISLEESLRIIKEALKFK